MKQYAAHIWTSRPLTDDDLHNISLMKDMEIIQKTPIRVIHRRSPLERKQIIHWMEIEKVAGGSNYYLLHLCTQAQNKQFAAVFNLEDYKAAHEKCYKQIAAVVAKYQDTKKNINEGLNFYVTLQAQYQLPTKVLLQLTTAFRDGGLRKLALAGDEDLIYPPKAVYETVKLIFPEHLVTYKVFGKPEGPHYAHYDLVGGRKSTLVS